MADTSEAAVSYERDIRPLFRQLDIDSMRRAGHFDLSSYDDVVERADHIIHRLEGGNMPCDGAWPARKVDLFRRWVDGGKQP